MRKVLRAIPSTFVVGLVAAAIASAAPSPHDDLAPEPSPPPAPPPAATGPVVEDPRPREPGGRAVDGATPEAEHTPDRSSCAGLTGLDNAICRHELLLQEDPDHAGRGHSLGRLEDNRGGHEGGERGGNGRAGEGDGAGKGEGGGNGKGGGRG